MPLRPRLQLPRSLPLWPRLHVLRKEVAHKAAAGEDPAPLLSLLALRREFLRFLTRRLASPAEAEDVLQACYLKACEHAGALQEAESSRAWFYRILRNALVDHYRHHAAEGRAHQRWGAEQQITVAADDLAHDVVCHCVEQVLALLNPAYAAIVEQVDLKEVRLADFAAAAGITVSNATVRLHRARKALRQRLTETCGACATHGCLNCTCAPVLPAQNNV